MSPKLRFAFRRKLLRWYDQNKRDLPWRTTRDPYAIWISETMLQQTRVAVVIPYYRRFMAEFPGIDALARAPLARVQRFWTGLGYYRRAKHLHQAARQIVSRHAGRMPDDFAALRALAGIGEYTAGALLSIAFGKPYPAVDGNARRVIGRVIGDDDESRIRAFAAELVPSKRPGEYNQAVMELGATLCTPKERRCSQCPLRSVCASGESAAAPLARRKALRFISVLWPLAIVRRGGKILLRRRGTKGLLDHLWELPGGEASAGDALAALLRRHLQDLNFSLPRPRKLGALRHAITHRRIIAPVYLYDLSEQHPRALPGARWRWVEIDKLRLQATSSMTLKACKLIPHREEASH